MRHNYPLFTAIFASFLLYSQSAIADDNKKHTAPEAGAEHKAANDHKVGWGYEGAGGPAHWGALSEANQACSIGTQQSPIDLSGARGANLAPIDINWNTFTPRVRAY